MNTRSLAVANDLRIIPGVHHYCDEWCDYCPARNRCLAFRCMTELRKQRARRDGDPCLTTMEEAVAFIRDIAAIEGTRTNDLHELLAHAPGGSGVDTSDPLASLAWRYAVRAAVFMMPVTHEAVRAKPHPSGPRPAQVVLWYHLRIHMRIFRALVSRDEASASGERLEEAHGSAKLALVCVQRSRAALLALESVWNKPAVADLVSMLDALERGIDERFPQARSFIRVGLDSPVA